MHHEPSGSKGSWFPSMAAIIAIAVGASALLGWILDVPVLKSVVPGLSTMKVNTALAFVFAGLSLSFSETGRFRRLATGCGVAAGTIGLLTLLEYATGANLGIDQLLVRDSTVAASFPGRPGLNTALCFVLLSVALLRREFDTPRDRWVTRGCAAAGGAVALAALIGYGYSTTSLTGIVSSTQMALHTAAVLFLLSIAALARDPGLGLSVERKIQLGFGVAFLALVSVGAATLRITAATAASTAWVAHTLEVEAALLRTAALTGDAASGVRGYVVTGDDALLAPYTGVRGILDTVTARIRSLVTDNPPQELRADSLTTLVGQRLEWLDRTVRLRRAGGPGSVKPAVLREGEFFMAQLRSLLARMQGDEGRLLVLRRATLQARTRQARLAAWAGTILAFGAVTGAGTVIHREFGSRRRAEARFGAVVESAPSGMVMIGRGGTIVLVNREIERQFGYAREDLLGQPIERLVPERFRGGHPGLRTEFFTHLQTRAMGAGRELYGLRKDGTEIPVEIGLNPIGTEEGQFVLASVVDITQRKRSETELKRSNEELERFAYVASHDLQEPLRMVGSYVQLLAKRYKGKLDSDADEFIGFALDGAIRMQRLIQDLLAFSRVSTKGVIPIPTDADAVLGSALASLKLTIEESGAAVTHDALPTILADPGQLEHVFLNLISNALKFRGTAPPVLHIGASREAQVWRFTVRDNGIGIEPQYFDRIFVVFQRLNARADYPGTGIGLAIVKKIVERHGGRIWVESAPGSGTTFTFTLPAVSET